MRDQEFKTCLEKIVEGSYSDLRKLYRYFNEAKTEDKAVETRKEEAIKFFMQQAASTHNKTKGFALAVIGDFYYNGYGVVINKDKASDFYQGSSHLGNPLGVCGMGMMAYYEIFDNDAAVTLFKMVADPKTANYPLAQFWLGYLSMHGFGTKEDPNEALKWYQLAGEQGEDRAYFMTGLMYQCSIGVKRNPNQARAAFQRALTLNPHSKAAGRMTVEEIDAGVYDLYWGRTKDLTYKRRRDDLYGVHSYRVTIKNPDVDMFDGHIKFTWSDPLVQAEARVQANLAFNSSRYGQVIRGLLWTSALAMAVGGLCIYLDEVNTGVGLIVGGALAWLILYKMKLSRIQNLTRKIALNIAKSNLEKEIMELMIRADKSLIEVIKKVIAENEREARIKSYRTEQLDDRGNEQRAEGEPEPGAEGYPRAQAVAYPQPVVYAGGGSILVQQREMSGMNYRPTNFNPSAPPADRKDDHVIFIPARAV